MFMKKKWRRLTEVVCSNLSLKLLKMASSLLLSWMRFMIREGLVTIVSQIRQVVPPYSAQLTVPHESTAQ